MRGRWGLGGRAPRFTSPTPPTSTPPQQQKGMVGIDSKVSNPRTKCAWRGGGGAGVCVAAPPPSAAHPSTPSRSTVQGAYVITFGRAGEDNKKFKLGDVERTLEGFAGADYNLQDALTAATDKKAVKRAGDGPEYYDYEVVGPVRVERERSGAGGEGGGERG